MSLFMHTNNVVVCQPSELITLCDKGILGGFTLLEGEAPMLAGSNSSWLLYHFQRKENLDKTPIRLIPYYAGDKARYLAYGGVAAKCHIKPFS